ncbi:MAG: type IV pilus modification protein PilV [Anaerolineales bacterium]
MNIKRVFKSTTAGFTLLEVLIALVILAVGILGAASMQVSSMRGNSHAFDLTTAATLAADRMEILMALPYDDAALSDTMPENAPDTVEEFNTALSDVSTALQDLNAPDRYGIFWNVAENFPIENCKTVRVIVIRDDRGTPRRVEQTFTTMQ